MKTRLICFIVTLLVFQTVKAQKIYPLQESISESKGVYGYIYALGGPAFYRTNEISRFMTINPDSRENTRLTESPDNQKGFLFSIPFETGYTIRPQKTSVYIQNKQENFLIFEMTQQLGIKQRLKASGILKFGLSYYDLGTKVWQDLYNNGLNKETTEKHGYGFEVSLDEISGTGFAIQYNYRSIRINNENSGILVDLLPEQLKMLNRNGIRHSIEIMYNYAVNSKNGIEPLFQINRNISEGKSVSYLGYKTGVAYYLRKATFSFQAEVYSGYRDYDDENPVYHIKQEDKSMELQGILLLKNPWDLKPIGSQPFMFTLRSGFFYLNSNIEYLSSSTAIFQLGICFPL